MTTDPVNRGFSPNELATLREHGLVLFADRVIFEAGRPGRARARCLVSPSGRQARQSGVSVRVGPPSSAGANQPISRDFVEISAINPPLDVRSRGQVELGLEACPFT
jgi:hypothetical protein